MYQISGSLLYNCMAVEVDYQVKSLNSSDAFLILSDQIIIWQGIGARSDEKKLAMKLAEQKANGKDIKIIKEGEEPEDFFN